MRAIPSRAVLFVGGTILSALCFVVCERTSLGNGPFYVVQDAVARLGGLSMGTTAILMGFAVIAVAVALRAPIGPGTFGVPVIFGTSVGVIDPVIPRIGGQVLRWALFAGGSTLMMLGSAMVVAAAIGTMALDGVMVAIARLVDRGTAPVRLAMEGFLAGAGFLLGGRVGAGTLLMGVVAGHSYSFWSRSLRRVGWVHPPGGGSPFRPSSLKRVHEVPGDSNEEVDRRGQIASVAEHGRDRCAGHVGSGLLRS